VLFNHTFYAGFTVSQACFSCLNNKMQHICALCVFLSCILTWHVYVGTSLVGLLGCTPQTTKCQLTAPFLQVLCSYTNDVTLCIVLFRPSIRPTISMVNIGQRSVQTTCVYLVNLMYSVLYSQTVIISFHTLTMQFVKELVDIIDNDSSQLILLKNLIFTINISVVIHILL